MKEAMNIVDFPIEIIILIANELDGKSVAHWKTSNKLFNEVLQALLNKRKLENSLFVCSYYPKKVVDEIVNEEEIKYDSSNGKYQRLIVWKDQIIGVGIRISYEMFDTGFYPDARFDSYWYGYLLIVDDDLIKLEKYQNKKVKGLKIMYGKNEKDFFPFTPTSSYPVDRINRIKQFLHQKMRWISINGTFQTCKQLKDVMKNMHQFLYNN